MKDAHPGNGRITTHVLDLFCGQPARGMKLELWRIGEVEERRLLRLADTNADGRVNAPMLSGSELSPGVYELVFCVGDYYQEQGVEQGESSIFDRVPIRFRVRDADGHYHVPLLVAPGGYSTYRGS
ncbi:hydroxyisourate hydrolase [Paenibacillus filicis]|uniref:5-hydroxyisourate hydrolase n=1 Tax=Paenibacillus filicis TaxID=669464 RepID=A0ABU9DFF8_9BACL